MTSSVPINYITADPSIEVSISITSDGIDKLDESQIIPSVAPMSAMLQSGLTLGHAPPAACECSEPPLSTVCQSSAFHNSPIPSGTTVPSGLTLRHTPPATHECSEPPLSTVHQSSAFHNSPIPSSTTVSSSRNVSGWPTNKSLTLIEEFFAHIDTEFAEFASFIKMDEDKLMDKYCTKWGKHASSPTLRHWNYYQQYYQHNLEQSVLDSLIFPLIPRVTSQNAMTSLRWTWVKRTIVKSFQTLQCLMIWRIPKLKAISRNTQTNSRRMLWTW